MANSNDNQSQTSLSLRPELAPWACHSSAPACYKFIVNGWLGSALLMLFMSCVLQSIICLVHILDTMRTSVPVFGSPDVGTQLYYCVSLHFTVVSYFCPEMKSEKISQFCQSLNQWYIWEMAALKSKGHIIHVLGSHAIRISLRSTNFVFSENPKIIIATPYNWLKLQGRVNTLE